MTAQAGRDTDSPSGKHSKNFGRPVTELVTERAESATDFPKGEYPEFVDRPVTESVMAWAGSDTNFPNGEYSEIVDRPVTEAMTARATETEEILVMKVSTVATEQSENGEMVLDETDKRDIPVYRSGTFQYVEIRNNHRNCVEYCCGVCGKADGVNRLGTSLCWNCCCLISWNYSLSR